MGRPPSRVGFVADVASAAKALLSQPSVPLVSLAVWLLPSVIIASTVPGHRSVGPVLAIMLATTVFQLGWYGAERVFFQRRFHGEPVAVRHLLGLVGPFIGRFFAVGLPFGIVLSGFFFAAFSVHRPGGGPMPGWFHVGAALLLLGMDFALTFVTPALAYTTRSASRAMGIGFAMIRQTWPRSALYVLCPPLALNLLHLIHPVSNSAVQWAINPLLLFVSLLAKGAIAAFYLRERGTYSKDGAAYITDGVPAAPAPLGAIILGWTLIIGGILRALFGGFEILIYGILPLRSSNAPLDGAGMALVVLASGIALVKRRSWGRPWIVCVSVATLWEFAWTVLGTGNAASRLWEMFRFTPGIIGGVRLLLVIGTPVVAVLALLLLAARGRRWLPPSPRGQWVVAALVIVVANGTISYRLWRDDPQRRQQRFEQELAALSVEPGKGRLVIVPTFDGAPLDAIFEAAVKARLQEHKTNKRLELTARYRNGVIDVPDVDTGVYGLTFGIDANTENGFGDGWGMPGDFISYGGGRWDLLRNGLTVRQEVPVYRIMRLLQPEDTGFGLTRGSIPPEFRSPLTIAWEPVPGARTYGYSIVRRSSDRSQRYVAGSQGPNTTWTVELPPTKPSETYVLALHAYGKSGQVGIFEVQGAGWRGWDYQFRIAE